MFWRKNKIDPPRPQAPARPPVTRPAPRPGPGSSSGWTPQPDTKKRVTLRDLPEMLLANGKVTREQLQRAMKIQRESGDFIGEILVNEGVLDENSLVAFLAKYCKIPYLSLLDYLIDESLLGLVPPDFCLRHRLVPIDKMGRNLTVAMVNPLDALALETLREGYPDLRIKRILCTAKHYDAVTKRLFTRPSVLGKFPYLAEASSGRQELSTPSEPAAKSVPAEGMDLDAVDTEIFEVKPLPSEAPMAEAEDLPLALEFDDMVEVASSYSGEKDARETLLDSVFSMNSEGIPSEFGESEESNGDPSVDEITRKMTTAMVSSMRNTYVMLARRVSLFRGLDPESVAKLFARGKTVEYEAGQTIFQKGELGRCMFVILSGSVDIVNDGRILARLGQGENFGEMALLSNAARSAVAQTTAATSLLMLSFADITQGLDSATSIRLLVNITVTLSSRLRKAQGR